jgi:hypothetical protein
MSHKFSSFTEVWKKCLVIISDIQNI